VVADDDGVVVVSRQDAAEVLAAARSRLAAEAAKRARLAAGELGVDMYGLRRLIADLGVGYEDGDAGRTPGSAP
jgi:4-hydroxy-4-methyl-2-oxoglutarate aldolase